MVETKTNKWQVQKASVWSWSPRWRSDPKVEAWAETKALSTRWVPGFPCALRQPRWSPGCRLWAAPPAAFSQSKLWICSWRGQLRAGSSGPCGAGAFPQHHLRFGSVHRAVNPTGQAGAWVALPRSRGCGRASVLCWVRVGEEIC